MDYAAISRAGDYAKKGPVLIHLSDAFVGPWREHYNSKELARCNDLDMERWFSWRLGFAAAIEAVTKYETAAIIHHLDEKVRG